MSGEKEIVFVCERFWPMVGGGERHAEDLGAELIRRGWRVRMLTRRISPDWSEEDTRRGIRIHRIGPVGNGRLAKFRMGSGLRRFLRGERQSIALLYVCGFRTLGTPVTRLARSFGIPVILRAEACGELSGEYIWKSPHRSENTWARVLLRPLIALRNRTLRRANLFLAIAGIVDREFAEHGIPEEKRVLIPNGIDFKRFHPPDEANRRALRHDLGFPPDALVFAYAGKLNRGKGLEVLLSAFEGIDDPRARLLWIGSGGGMFLSCEEELRRRAEQSESFSRMCFTGYVENVESYLGAADVFVFPSEMEAFGLAPIEASACGLPLISTEAGALRETMRHEETALTFPVGDEKALQSAMLRLMADPALRQSLADRAYRFFKERYSLDAVASRHEEIFQQLLSRDGKRVSAGPDD